MKKAQLLTYKIVIEQEKKNGKKQFLAYAPQLGISDFGPTMKQAQENIREAIICHLEALKKLGEDLPLPENRPTVIREVSIPTHSL